MSIAGGDLRVRSSLRTIVAVLLLCTGTDTVAQTPSFEAASIKRRTEPGGGFMGRQPGGRFTAQGVPLQDLIVFAYGVQPYQIVDGPRWMDTERWDVTATGVPGAPGDVPTTRGVDRQLPALASCATQEAASAASGSADLRFPTSRRCCPHGSGGQSSIEPHSQARGTCP